MKQLVMSSSPHIRSRETTSRIMLDVLIALAPALVASVLVFGPRALLVTAVSVAASLAFEWLYRKLTRQHDTLADGSTEEDDYKVSFLFWLTDFTPENIREDGSR